MPITALGPGFFLEETLEDGHVRVEPDEQWEWALHMSGPTFSALLWSDLLDTAWVKLTEIGPGTHLIPRSVIEADAAADLRQAIEFADLTDGCVMPHCQQDVVHRDRGFNICATHDALLQDWDSLVG